MKKLLLSLTFLTIVNPAFSMEESGRSKPDNNNNNNAHQGFRSCVGRVPSLVELCAKKVGQHISLDDAQEVKRTDIPQHLQRLIVAAFLQNEQIDKTIFESIFSQCNAIDKDRALQLLNTVNFDNELSLNTFYASINGEFIVIPYIEELFKFIEKNGIELIKKHRQQQEIGDLIFEFIVQQKELISKKINWNNFKDFVVLNIKNFQSIDDVLNEKKSLEDFFKDFSLNIIHNDEPFIGITINSKSQKVYTSHRSGLIKVWDIVSKKCIAAFNTNDPSINIIACHPNSEALVAIGETMQLWDLQNNHCLCKFDWKPFYKKIIGLAFTRNNCIVCDLCIDFRNPLNNLPTELVNELKQGSANLNPDRLLDIIFHNILEFKKLDLQALFDSLKEIDFEQAHLLKKLHDAERQANTVDFTTEQEEIFNRLPSAIQDVYLLRQIKHAENTLPIQIPLDKAKEYTHIILDTIKQEIRYDTPIMLPSILGSLEQASINNLIDLEIAKLIIEQELARHGFANREIIDFIFSQ